MDKVFISDRTLKQAGKNMPLSFREKIELSRMIDRLEVDAIELPAIRNKKVDPLLIKSISSAVKHAEIAVPVAMDAESVQLTWNSLREAPKARLQISIPVSSVQMEYLTHLKPAAVKSRVMETIRECRRYTDQIEMIAEDAFRGDRGFLIPLISSAIEAGARIITFQEAAGISMPEEVCQELREILSEIGPSEDVRFGIDCSNDLSLADACAVETVRQGIREIKAAAYPIGCASLANVARILDLKGEKLQAGCQVRREEIRRVTRQISALCGGSVPDASDMTVQETMQDGIVLSYHDSKESILRSIEQMGYNLSTEDQEKVYQAFLSVTEKKGSIGLKEMDAIIAAEAMQVPPAYQVLSYLFNSGKDVGAMAHLKVSYGDQVLDGVSSGDGIIDAAFLALEKAVGRHFELDEFQIQAVTEGREAMGESIVRLRNQGKLYSGRGISTDIVVASIMAYVNALNKIVYEEEVAE